MAEGIPPSDDYFRKANETLSRVERLASENNKLARRTASDTAALSRRGGVLGESAASRQAAAARVTPGGVAVPASARLGPGDLRGAEADLGRYNTRLGETAETTGRATAANEAYAASSNRARNAEAIRTAQMHRLGAASTTYLEALGRGTVTIRDIGRETVLTTAKFANWLVAGGLVFGALGAVQQLGAGAIDTASGVKDLDRVVNDLDTDAAQAELRRLAREMNLPINVVSDAAFEMGKVWKNQADTFKGAESVLLATKVAELDVATASRYLTAVVKGFNLEAGDQITVLDQLNEAQNQFGVNIQDTFAGLAGAAGTGKVLGASIEELLSVVVAARQAGGVSGNVAGTALQRLATHMETGREELRKFGIDIDRLDLGETLAKAFEIAPTLNGQKLRQLAVALAGTQYGPRVLLPALSRPDIRAEALQNLAPENVKGSAYDELEDVLGRAEQRLAAIGTMLQSIGSNLAQAGFLDLFLLGVGAVEKMLGVANQVLEVFNELPAPLRHALSIAGQLTAAFFAMRRFSVGRALSENNPLRNALTSPRLGERLATEQLAIRKEGLLQYAGSREGSIIAAQVEGDQRALALAQKEQEEALKRVATIDREMAAIRRGDAAALNAQASATATGGTMTPGGVIVPSGAASDSTKQATRSIRTAQTTLRRRVEQYGLMGGLLARGGDTLRGASDRVVSRLSGAGTIIRSPLQSMKRLGTGLAGVATRLGGFIGPFEIALGAFLYIETVTSQLYDSTSKAIAEFDANTGPAGDPAALEGQIDSLTTGFKANFVEWVTGLGDQIENANAQMADTVSQDRARVQQALLSGEFTTASAGAIFPEDISSALDQYITQLDKGQISKGRFDESISNLLQTVRSGPWDATVIGKMETEIADATIDTEGASADYDRFKEIFGEQLQKRIEAYSTLLEGGIGGRSDVRRLIQHAIPQINEALVSDNPTERAFAVQGLESLVSGLEGQAKSELDFALSIAKGQRERNKAYSDYIEAVNPEQLAPQFEKFRNDLDSKLKEARGKSSIYRTLIEGQKSVQAAVRKNLRDAYADSPMLEGLSYKDPQIQALRDELKSSERSSKQIREALDTLKKTQREAAKRLEKIAKEEARDARFEENLQIYEARTQLGVTRRGDGVEAVEYELHRVRQVIERAIKHYGRNSKEVLDLLDREQDLIQQRFQAELDLISAQGDFQASLADSPAEEAQARLETAERLLARVQANPRSTRLDLLEAMTEVNEARKAVEEAVVAQAEEIQAAHFELLRARADQNEVRLARIAIREARAEVNNADTKAERITGRAHLITARHGLRDAIAQREIEDIEFQADIGKLTLEQQISAYQRLLRTLELTRDMRRDLRRRIEQLKQEAEDASSGFELDVGNIKLPTIYEIRRAMEGGINNSPQIHLTQENNYNISGTSDPEGVAREVGRRQSDAAGKNRNLMRSAGLVG